MSTWIIYLNLITIVCQLQGSINPSISILNGKIEGTKRSDVEKL